MSMSMKKIIRRNMVRCMGTATVDMGSLLRFCKGYGSVRAETGQNRTRSIRGNSLMMSSVRLMRKFIISAIAHRILLE